MESEWVLVPRVPTEAMMKASVIRTRNLDGTRTTTFGANVWSAMLAAAPSAPTSHESPVSGDGDAVERMLEILVAAAQPLRNFHYNPISDQDRIRFLPIANKAVAALQPIEGAGMNKAICSDCGQEFWGPPCFRTI